MDQAEGGLSIHAGGGHLLIGVRLLGGQALESALHPIPGGGKGAFPENRRISGVSHLFRQGLAVDRVLQDLFPVAVYAVAPASDHGLYAFRRPLHLAAAEGHGQIGHRLFQQLVPDLLKPPGSAPLLIGRRVPQPADVRHGAGERDTPSSQQPADEGQLFCQAPRQIHAGLRQPCLLHLEGWYIPGDSSHTQFHQIGKLRPRQIPHSVIEDADRVQRRPASNEELIHFVVEESAQEKLDQ